MSRRDKLTERVEARMDRETREELEAFAQENGIRHIGTVLRWLARIFTLGRVGFTREDIEAMRAEEQSRAPGAGRKPRSN